MRRHNPHLDPVNEHGDHQGGRVPPHLQGQPQYPVPPHLNNYGQQQQQRDGGPYMGDQGSLPRDGTLPRDQRDFRDPYHRDTIDRNHQRHGGPAPPNHAMDRQYPPPPPQNHHQAMPPPQNNYVNHQMQQQNDYRGPPKDQRNFRDYRDTQEYGRRPDIPQDGSMYRGRDNKDMGGFPPPPPNMAGPHSPHSPSSGQFPHPPFPTQQGMPPPSPHNGQSWHGDPNASLRRARHDSDRGANVPSSPGQQYDRVSVAIVLNVFCLFVCLFNGSFTYTCIKFNG